MILLLVAAVALVSAVALARGRDRAATSTAERYVCPMHPEVTSRAPGDCPICRMALERVTDSERIAPAAASGRSAVDTPKRRVFVEQVRAPAWLATDGVVTAVLHKDDLVGITPDEHVRFFRVAAPNLGIEVRLVDEPPSPWDSSTSKVRFRLGPPAGPPRGQHDHGDQALESGPRPGDVGWVQIAARSRELLVVPSSSVLYSHEGAYVLVPSREDGTTFTRRPVEIGRKLSGTTVVLSGLRENEPIVAGDTFSMEAARRFEAAQGHDVPVKP